MEASFYPYLGALCWIGMLLMLGTLIRAKVPLFQKLLFPSSLIGGLIGFVLINLDLVGMPTSTGWKDITPNIFSMITFHLFAFGFVGIGLLQTKKPASGKVVMRGALWIALVFGMPGFPHPEYVQPKGERKMKRLMTLLLAAGLVLGATSAAKAVDFKMTGLWQNRVSFADRNFE